MSENSSIEWTNATWNPLTGCTKVSAGCKNCYAERFSERFRGVKGHPFECGFDLMLRPERLEQPLQWKKPRMIFVNSMSDLFHKNVPDAFIDKVFNTMEQANWHEFQLLTKRSNRMHYFMKDRYKKKSPPKNVWLGVSVENKEVSKRIEDLQETPAAIRFLSMEPLIGQVGKINLSYIHWVIVGGESGPCSRPMKPEWVREIRDQCFKNNIPFFFKQWGGPRPKENGRTLDGCEWSGFPVLKERRTLSLFE